MNVSGEASAVPNEIQVPIRDGLALTAWLAGPEDGELVVCLHGFPQSRHTWQAQLPALAQAGYRVLAPDQRGYSPGARPPPDDPRRYGIDELINDVLDAVKAVRSDAARFHLVAHDWGGQVAWVLAGRHPQRLLSLAVLSRPHTAAFQRALQLDEGQRAKSSRHKEWLDPATGPALLADDARGIREKFERDGVSREAVDRYLSVVGSPQAMEAALAWYRSPGAFKDAVPAITVPTLYLWGDADAAVGRMAAIGTEEFIAAPFRFVKLPGAGHFLTDRVPDEVTAELLAHFARHGAAKA